MNPEVIESCVLITFKYISPWYQKYEQQNFYNDDVMFNTSHFSNGTPFVSDFNLVLDGPT